MQATLLLEPLMPYGETAALIWVAALLILIATDAITRRSAPAGTGRIFRFLGGVASLAIIALPLLASILVAKASIVTGDVVIGMAGFILFPIAAVLVAGVVKSAVVWILLKLFPRRVGRSPSLASSKIDQSATLNGKPIER